MASAWRKLDRWILLVVTGILATSTGVASVATGQTELATGHTAYVQVVAGGKLGAPGTPPPVEYGLASFRESWLFGAYERTRILDEDQGRMVFVWNADAPDPRQDPTLMPTGQHAVILDRNGNGWSLHEFSYRGVGLSDDDAFADWKSGALDQGTRYYTYGVLVGAVYKHDAPWPGDARYNWAISYRVDKLFPDGPSVPAFDPAQVADSPALDSRTNPALESSVAGSSGQVSTSVEIVNPADAPEPRPAEYHLQFGLGMAPELMRA